MNAAPPGSQRHPTLMGVVADPARATQYFERACRGGVAASCFAAAGLYRAMREEALARKRRRQACDLSLRAAIARTAYFAVRPAAAPAATPAFCVDAQP